MMFAHIGKKYISKFKITLKQRLLVILQLFFKKTNSPNACKSNKIGKIIILICGFKSNFGSFGDVISNIINIHHPTKQ